MSRFTARQLLQITGSLNTINCLVYHVSNDFLTNIQSNICVKIAIRAIFLMFENINKVTSRDLKQSPCVKTAHHADKLLVWIPFKKVMAAVNGRAKNSSYFMFRKPFFLELSIGNGNEIQRSLRYLSRMFEYLVECPSKYSLVGTYYIPCRLRTFAFLSSRNRKPGYLVTIDNFRSFKVIFFK